MPQQREVISSSLRAATLSLLFKRDNSKLLGKRGENFVSLVGQLHAASVDKVNYFSCLATMAFG
jgi:hypothetical protein